jgi:hypothetical protein
MYELRRAWEAAHGAGSVVELALSAAAAQVLGQDLGIVFRRRGWVFVVDAYTHEVRARIPKDWSGP